MASPATQPDIRVTPTRTNFMIMAMAAIFGFISLGYVGAVIAYLIPPKGEGGRSQLIGPVSQLSFSAGVAGPFVYDATGRGDAQGVFAVQTGTDTSSVNLVLEQTCRHLGCPVAWTAAANTFNCPCHGSVFAKNGDRVSGPTPAGLYHHQFEIRNGQLWVQGRLT